MATRTPPAPEVDVPLGLSSRIGRIAAVAVALAMVLFWIWILTGGPKKANPDRLDDRAWVDDAKVACDGLRAELDERGLLTPDLVPDAQQRADELDLANPLVADLVDELERTAPTTGDDAKSLAGWFADWHQYLEDRDAYAEALRTDPDARFLVTENAELRDSVDRTIEVFADVNDMPQCATPGDVG